MAVSLWSPFLQATFASLEQIEKRIGVIEQGLYADEDDIWAELQQMETLLPQASADVVSRHQRLICWFFEGSLEQGIEQATQLLQSAIEAEDDVAATDLQMCRGQYYYLSNQYEQAQRDYDQALENALQLEHDYLIAHAASYRGKLRGTLGQVALALADYMTAQRYFERDGATYWRNENLMALANTYRRLGDFRKALEIYHMLQSAPNFAESDSIMIQLYQNMGAVYEDLLQPKQALAAYQEAERRAKRLNDPYEIALNNLFVGGLLSTTGAYVEALDYLERSSHPLLNADAARSAMRQTYAAQALLGQGKSAMALQRVRLAEPYMQSHKGSRYAVHYFKLHAKILAATGDWSGAYNELEAHIDTKRELDKQALRQQGIRVKEEFELERIESDRQRLALEQQLQQQFIEARSSAEWWQKATITLLILFTVHLTVNFAKSWRRRRYR